MINQLRAAALTVAALTLLPLTAHAQAALSTADIPFAGTIHSDITLHQDTVAPPCSGQRTEYRTLIKPYGCVRVVQRTQAESANCVTGYVGENYWIWRITQYYVDDGTSTGRRVYNNRVQTDIVNTCRPESSPPVRPPVTPSPSTPAAGTQFVIPQSISAMVCGPSDPGYSAALPTLINAQYRDQLIAYYRGFGIAGRCPEMQGYSYWLEDWFTRASNAANGPFHAPGGNPNNLGWSAYVNAYMSELWDEMKRAIDASAAGNDEAGQGGVSAANGLCQRAANAAYGAGKTTAIYILKSGNQCRLTAVH